MTTEPTKPPATVSVIIPTYNWSSALRLAMSSVLAQTFADFELLVVGDACTDDSEAVVRSFDDPRIRWINLGTHHGSQYGPNNVGLALAQGRYVAYLGHDDIWWPTHLEAAMAVFGRAEVDIVAATSVMYAPPESGFRSAAGLFPDGVFTPRCFFPPSSMVHTRELIQKAGYWRSVEDAGGPVDVDFLARCVAGGARIAATEELTVFKFNAGWRRNVYRHKRVAEQEAVLARALALDEGFRRRELILTLRSVIEDRFQRIEFPLDKTAGQLAPLWWNRFKGAVSPEQPAGATLGDEVLRFFPDEAYAGYEWHHPEPHPVHGRIRWSGPSRISAVPLPVRVERPARICLHLLHAVGGISMVQDARLIANGHPLASDVEHGPDDTLLWSARIAGPDLERVQEAQRDALVLELHLPYTRRPIDLGDTSDRRWLGVAVIAVELSALADA